MQYRTMVATPAAVERRVAITRTVPCVKGRTRHMTPTALKMVRPSAKPSLFARIPIVNPTWPRRERGGRMGRAWWEGARARVCVCSGT
jgi:hypothetical protein